jgi:hypothetical protein
MRPDGVGPMHELKLDIDNNRLTIILRGVLTKNEGEKVVGEVVAAVNQLKRGFDIINDISGFEGSDKKSEEFFQGALKFLKIRGVNRVIRVVGGARGALVKFATGTKLINNYPVQYVPAMKDALQLLNSKK